MFDNDCKYLTHDIPNSWKIEKSMKNVMAHQYVFLYNIGTL